MTTATEIKRLLDPAGADADLVVEMVSCLDAGMTDDMVLAWCGVPSWEPGQLAVARNLWRDRLDEVTVARFMEWAAGFSIFGTSAGA